MRELSIGVVTYGIEGEDGSRSSAATVQEV